MVLRLVQLAGGLSYALAALLPQSAALILLSTADFGRFSAVYLVYAWGLSLGVSLVAEPWQLRQLARGANSHLWRSYSSVAFMLSIVVGLAATVLSYFLGWALVDALAGGLAVSAGCLRNLVRHYVAQRRLFVFLIGGDLTFVALFGSFLALVLLYGDTLTAILLGWTAASLGSLVFVPRLQGQIIGPQRWVRLHKDEMRRLIVDSALMDVGAIGTPFVVAAMLDFASFGVYRAVGSVTAPARMILEPARPYIFQYARAAARTPTQQRHAFVLVGSLGFGLGTGAFGALAFLPWETMGIEVLGDLSAYAFIVSVCVIAEFVGHYSYIAVRAGPHGRGLFRGRLLQTTVVVVLPVIGALIGGGPGAIGGYVGASCITCLVWVSLAKREKLL